MLRTAILLSLATGLRIKRTGAREWNERSGSTAFSHAFA